MPIQSFPLKIHKVDQVRAATPTGGISLQDDLGNLGLTVEDGGQIGIGTATPSADLEVVGSLKQSTGTVTIESNGNATVSAAAAMSINSLSNTHAINVGNENRNGPINIATNGDRVVTIGEDGNTSTEVVIRSEGGLTLDAGADTAAITGDVTVTGSCIAASFSGDGSALTGISSPFSDGGSNVYLSTATDSVGLGITDAKTKLDVVHDYATSAFEVQMDAAEGGGEIVKIGAGTTIAGKLYTLYTDGSWDAADADAAAFSVGLMGIPLGTSPSDGIILRGFARIDAMWIGGTAAIGKPLYASPTSGQFEVTAPSASAQFVRIVGYILDTYDTGGGSLDCLIFFNPDPTWVEVA